MGSSPRALLLHAVLLVGHLGGGLIRLLLFVAEAFAEALDALAEVFHQARNAARAAEQQERQRQDDQERNQSWEMHWVTPCAALQAADALARTYSSSPR